MVQKNGKCGLNNGATMKFGETNYLMKRQTSGFFIRKLFNGGQGLESDYELTSKGDVNIANSSPVCWELESLRDVEDAGGAGIPVQLANDRGLVYVSLNKHKRWDLLEKLKDHMQFRRMFEEKLNSINSPVLGITLVEKYGDYLHGHLSSKDACSCISYESDVAWNALPIESRRKASFPWELRDKSKQMSPDSEEMFKAPKKSASHNQHYRGVQRHHSADRKLLSQSSKKEKTPTKPLRNLQSNLGFQDGGPEVLYEVTYPRPLDASSGCQDLKVRRWNWCFRDKKSKSKCKGQKISRRADNYCMTQKELQDLNGDVDLGLYLYLSGRQEPEEFEPVMLGDHMDEQKLCQLEETSRCVAEVSREVPHEEPKAACDGDHCLTYRDPECPWGTPFELSMIKVDGDALFEDEFEFLETPNEDLPGDDFEVVEERGQSEPLESPDGMLLVQKEDAGFIHVDSTSIINSPRQTVTLADYLKPPHSKRSSKEIKNKRASKKKS
ncbi:uncharacterized protein LOC135463674 [Liolophura sinensis]|uniref:uncharacterized protein LOC135463674 n=1 Tax=Liolophura sinensis TaxID=3198878 RepID=UPI00315883B2